MSATGTWILIVFFSYFRTGVAIEHIEFRDKAACLYAAKQVEEHSNLVSGLCVPKASRP